MQTDLTYLPPNLPIPTDDGACDHLLHRSMPALHLRATNGQDIALHNITGRLVIYCYPMTGPAEVPLPPGWDEIPGARGCTPQACSFRDHYHDLLLLNTTVFGLSTQSPATQLAEKQRIHLPFDLLSDEQLIFIHALQLPTHQVQQLTLVKRLTLVFEKGRIIRYFYPVFPPDKHIYEVMDYLRQIPAAAAPEE